MNLATAWTDLAIDSAERASAVLPSRPPISARARLYRDERPRNPRNMPPGKMAFVTACPLSRSWWSDGRPRQRPSTSSSFPLLLHGPIAGQIRGLGVLVAAAPRPVCVGKASRYCSHTAPRHPGLVGCTVACFLAAAVVYRHT